MEKEELQKNIALYYSKLPPQAQEVFSKMEWLATLEKISERYGLNDKQKEVLGTETTLLLLGMVHPVEYEENLSKELALSPDSMAVVMKEVENSILLDIRQSIVEAFEANKKSEQVTETPKSDIVQNLDSRFDKLPENIQDVVEKSNYQSTLYAISTAHKLSVTQMGILDTITTDLIIGSIHPDEFKTMVTKKLGLPPEETTNLVNEINEQIFKKIRGQLMNLNQPNPIRTYDGSQGPSTSNGISTDDASVLKSHGIEVIPVRTDGGSLRPPTSNGAGPEKQMPQIEKLEIQAPASETHPIVAQKLSGSVQAPTVKTEYVATNKPEIPKATKYAPGTDPYRIVPE